MKSSDDEIFDILTGSVKSDCLQIYQWDEPEEFRKLLFEILKKELKMKNENDYTTLIIL